MILLGQLPAHGTFVSSPFHQTIENTAEGVPLSALRIQSRHLYRHHQQQQPCYRHGNIPTSATSLTATTPQMAAAALMSKNAPNISQFVLGFLVGGMVCSATIASILFVYSMGAENIQRLLQFRKTVVRRVWSIFCLGMSGVKATLTKQDNRSWQKAWEVFKDSIQETRMAAQEGAEAIRLEAGLYAAAVGKPGLVFLQYQVDHFTPKFFAKIMKESLEDTFQSIHQDPKYKNTIESVELDSFDVGSATPELLDARAYELGPDAMAFDLDVKWKSDLQATILVKMKQAAFMPAVPIIIKNFQFDGVLRVVLSPLTPDPPGFGAALLSMSTTPQIGLAVEMAGGELTRMPFVRSEVVAALQNTMQDEFLWPRRKVVPSPKAPAKHKKIKTMLSQHELNELEMDDPLLQAEKRLAEDLKKGVHIGPLMTAAPPSTLLNNNNHDNNSTVGGVSTSDSNTKASSMMDIQVKDSDCMANESDEDLCIIDWDSLKLVSNKVEEHLKKKNILTTLRNAFQKSPVAASISSNSTLRP